MPSISNQELIRPIVSVVIPFAGDERGDTNNVQSWLNQAGVDQADFEIIVGTDPANQSVITRAKNLLREGDQLFFMRPGQHESNFESLLYHEGAVRARGHFILFTEDHVTARTDTLANVIGFLSGNPDTPGFALRTQHINNSAMARAEAAIYDDDLDALLNPEFWDLVRIRGTVIKRSVLESVGGYPAEYGLFSGLLLSARLWIGGHRLGYVTEAVICHLNMDQYSKMRDEIHDYMFGEVRYLIDAPTEMIEFIGLRSDTVDAFFHHPDLVDIAVPFLSNISRQKENLSDGGRTALREALEQLGNQAAGSQAIATGLVSENIHEEFLNAGDFESAKALFRKLWSQLAAENAIRSVRDLPSLGAGFRNPGAYPITECSFSSLIGLHAIEISPEDIKFRWAGPLIFIRLDLEAGHYRVSLELMPFRPSVEKVKIFIRHNRKEIDECEIDFSATSVSFPLHIESASNTGTVAVFADPFPSPGDFRKLSLPLSGVKIASTKASYSR